MGSQKNSVEAELREMDAQGVEFDMKQPAGRLARARAMSDEEFLDVEKRLKRKLDFRLLMVMWLMYIMNYLDRNNIAAAKVAGLASTLKLTSNQYSTAVAILFASYVVVQIPSNVFLAQLRPSVYLPLCMAAWGLMSALTGIVQNFTGLVLVRFFIGIAEAAYFPGALFLFSSWYKRSELSFRSALLFTGTQIGSAFSGLIGAGIQSGLNGARGLESWRWLFIIEGSITITIAIAAFFALPDWPSTTRWITPTERAVAEWRLITDAGQVDEDGGGWKEGFRLSFSDWRVYLFAFMFFCLQVASATQNFFPSVVQTLGYDPVITLLLTVPPYILALIVSVSNNWSADRNSNSSFHVMWPMALAILGFVLAAATKATGSRYFAMMIMIAGGHGANSVVLAWTQKTMIRPRIKRAAAIAFVNAIGTASQTWTSYLYPDSAKPQYVLAMSVNSGFALGCLLLAFTMRLILRRANKKLAAGTSVGRVMVGQSRAEVEGISSDERQERKAAFRYIT